MAERSKGITQIVVLVVIVFVGVLAYLIGSQKIKLQNTPAVINSIIPSPIVAEPTLDSTAKWNTYTNNQFGFTFKYPSEWKDVTDQGTVENGNREFRINTDKNEYVSGVVFNGLADTSKDLSWKKDIQLKNNRYILVTYTNYIGPGSEVGVVDTEVFNKVISTFKITN